MRQAGRFMDGLSLHYATTIREPGDGRVALVVEPGTTPAFLCQQNTMRDVLVAGRVLSAAKMDDHNTFEGPGVLIPREFNGVRRGGNVLNFVMPAMSVVVLELP